MPEEFLYGNPTHRRMGVAEDRWTTVKHSQNSSRGSFIKEKVHCEGVWRGDGVGDRDRNCSQAFFLLLFFSVDLTLDLDFG